MATRKWNGSKWCRRDKRLAIYLRDGCACCWCGHALEDGAQLTLDHLRPHSQGGGNEAANLVTACERCNKRRQDRSQAGFARAVADYIGHGVTADEILRHIRRCRRRVLPRDEAKALIERRGSYACALASL